MNRMIGRVNVNWESANTNFGFTFHGQVVEEVALHLLQHLVVVMGGVVAEQQLPDWSECILGRIFVFEHSAMETAGSPGS